MRFSAFLLVMRTAFLPFMEGVALPAVKQDGLLRVAQVCRTAFKCINIRTHTYIKYIYAEVVQIILYLCKKENPEEQGLKKVQFKKRNHFLLRKACLLSVGNMSVRGEQHIHRVRRM